MVAKVVEILKYHLIIRRVVCLNEYKALFTLDVEKVNPLVMYN